MKLTLRHRLPLVLGVAVLLTGASGAAAFALVAAHSQDAGTGTGNSLPIDDNHSSPTATPAPVDDHGVDATTEPAEQETHAPRSPEPAPTRVRESEASHDQGRTAEPEPSDNASHDAVETHASDDATPEPSETADDNSGASGSGPSSTTSGGGSDDGGGHDGSGSGSGDGGGHGSDG